jgi:cell division protein FtsB
MSAARTAYKANERVAELEKRVKKLEAQVKKLEAQVRRLVAEEAHRAEGKV